jgi:methylated-DNA-[protein]-cysteine S-methyltransferase
MMKVYCSHYESVWGDGSVTASAKGLIQVQLPEVGQNRGVHSGSTRTGSDLVESPLTREAARQLCCYFSGEHIMFELPLDPWEWSAFAAAVYTVVRAIPYGEVRSYGAVAAAAGHPGAARVVGRMMAVNRLPIVIPCHRVVAANGALTGYSAPGGLSFKARLLELEGAESVGS